MPNILTLNKIAPCGLEQFPAHYVYGGNVAAPDAIMLRSASMHDMPLDPATIAIARAGAGVNNIPIEACTAQGIAVFNTPGANANAVKELVVGALILSSRKIAEAIAWCGGLKGEGENVGKLVEKGKSAFAGPEIFGKTLGLVGLGAIGGLVANAAAALGMKVVGVDPYITNEMRARLDPGVELLDSWDAVAARSDYISLHLPLLPSTKGAIGVAFFAKAKVGCRLLNFSRAALVNDDDLLAALSGGKLAAYVTDFPTDALIGVPGVTAIPHLGASTPESEDNCAIMAAQQLTDYLERGEVRNSVNLPNASLPKKFETRVCVIHESGLDAHDLSDKISAALAENQPQLINLNGGKGYIALDTTGEVNPAIVEALPGVIKVRVLTACS